MNCRWRPLMAICARRHKQRASRFCKRKRPVSGYLESPSSLARSNRPILFVYLLLADVGYARPGWLPDRISCEGLAVRRVGMVTRLKHHNEVVLLPMLQECSIVGQPRLIGPVCARFFRRRVARHLRRIIRTAARPWDPHWWRGARECSRPPTRQAPVQRRCRYT